MYVTRIGRPDFSTKRDFVDNVSFEVYMLARFIPKRTVIDMADPTSNGPVAPAAAKHDHH